MNTNNNNNNSNMTNEAQVADLEKQVQCLKLQGSLGTQPEGGHKQQPATAATKIQMAMLRWRMQKKKHRGRKAAGAGCPRRAQCALRLRVLNAKLASKSLPESKRALLEKRRANLMARLSSRPPHVPHHPPHGKGKGKGKGGGPAGGPVVRLAKLQERSVKVAARLANEELAADERLILAARQDEIAGRIEHVKERLTHGKGHGHEGKGFGKGHFGKGHFGKGAGKDHHRGKGVGPCGMEDDDDDVCDFELVEPKGLSPERGMGPSDKLPEEDAGSDSSDDESEHEVDDLLIGVGEEHFRFFHGKGVGFQGKGHGKGEGFHGKGHGKGEGFQGKGHGKGEGFHGKGHGKGEGFHGKGHGKGEGFHGKGHGKGESFYGKGHGEGEGFPGKGVGKGEGFHGKGHGKGEGFPGKGVGKGEGFHGKSHDKGEGCLGKDVGKGEGFHGRGHGKGKGFHGYDASGGFAPHGIGGDF